HTPNLWMEGLIVGDLTRTEVGLVYIKGLAPEKIVGEVRSRIRGIKIDGILGSSYIEDFLQDQPLTIFPQVFSTERPDRVAGALLEGRVAVLTDGTPFALVVPNHLPAMIDAPDDYYEPFTLALFLRLLRYSAFFISVFLPGIYVAIINFHPELLPTVLFLRIAASREGIPFPAIVEAITIELIFEVLREAGVRLPQAVGSAISIVGALVLGDAAIKAGLVSPAMVIVVAMTAIASFTVPVFTLGIAARILRFGVIVLGGIFGMFGVQLALILLMTHLCALRSFGLPYLYPLAPLVTEDMKDTLFRSPWWAQTRRPRLIGYREPGRQPPGPRPGKRTGPRGEKRD
ncbi:MAG: spore germination protein, partial [Firmicutes bacterium]|nr:spore germination protein [Bacillota bacterium]